MTQPDTNISNQILHPMVEAIGKEEFARGLAEMPMNYSEEYENNCKPIGMEIIWQSGEIPDCDFSIVQQAILLAFDLWKNGETRVKAAKAALILLRGSKIQ